MKTAKLIILGVLLALTGCQQGGQEIITSNVYILKPGKPQAQGFSTERLARIDCVMNEYVRQKWIPGAVALISRHGKIVYQKSFGMRDMEKADPMQTDDLFRIASMTKCITSVAVMMLYEEGKFLLDDPVYKYIPEFKDPVVLDKVNLKDSTFTAHPAKSQITIRQLLTHTSGIGYGIFNASIKPLYDKAGIPDAFVLKKDVLADEMKKLAKMPLLHEPGEAFTYGLSVDILGYLVEVLSGKNLNAFLEERLFIPMGMKDTHFYLDDSQKDRLVKVYADNENGLSPATEERYNFPVMGAKTYYSGGSGLVCTALDYAKFCTMLLHHGNYNGKQFLSRKTIELMTENQTGKLNSFGLGFAIIDKEASVKMPGSPGSYYWGGIFNTSFLIDPEEDMVIVFLTQRLPAYHWDISQKMQVLAYQALVD